MSCLVCKDLNDRGGRLRVVRLLLLYSFSFLQLTDGSNTFTRIMLSLLLIIMMMIINIIIVAVVAVIICNVSLNDD